MKQHLKKMPSLKTKRNHQSLRCAFYVPQNENIFIFIFRGVFLLMKEN
jgi:hypothetical protein